MQIAFLCNVGNRDLFIDGVAVPADQTRAMGETIAAAYTEYKGRLTAPLIEPGLKAALREGTRADPARVSVYLFVTDQDAKETLPAHRSRDTVSTGQVLARLLKERFSSGPTGKVAEVRPVPIIGNPSDYDAMFRFYASRLNGKAFREEWDRVYVSPVGGVPAANFALLFRSIQRFGDRCVPIYLPEGRRSPLRLDLGASVRRDTLREVARRALEGYEFGRAAALLTEVRAEEALRALAEHAEHRLHFDFDGALRALESCTVPSQQPEIVRLVQDLKDELQDLADREDQTALVRELFFNLRVAWRQGRYVDFLFRLFRLQEALLRLVVERDLGLPTDSVGGAADPCLVEAIERDAALKAHFETPVGGRTLDYKREPSIPMLTHLLAFYAARGDGESADMLHGVVDLVRRLDGLAGLRNKSIGAHGFRGVSKGEIVAAYPAGNDVLQDVEEGLQWAGVDTSNDSLAEVRDVLLAQLGRGV